MKRVCNEGLRVECPSSKAFANGHEEINKKSNSGNSHTSIIRVFGGKVGIVMMVMVMSVPRVLMGVDERSHVR